MIKLGCKKQNKIFLAFQSYIELCEVSSSITPSWIRKFRCALPKQFQDKGIYIILCDTDTTNVIYKISDGLERPLSPESTKHKKEHKERKHFIEVEISNLLPTLIKEAKKQKLSSEDSEIK